MALVRRTKPEGDASRAAKTPVSSVSVRPFVESRPATSDEVMRRPAELVAHRGSTGKRAAVPKRDHDGSPTLAALRDMSRKVLWPLLSRYPNPSRGGAHHRRADTVVDDAARLSSLEINSHDPPRAVAPVPSLTALSLDRALVHHQQLVASGAPSGSPTGLLPPPAVDDVVHSGRSADGGPANGPFGHLKGVVVDSVPCPIVPSPEARFRRGPLNDRRHGGPTGASVPRLPAAYDAILVAHGLYWNEGETLTYPSLPAAAKGVASQPPPTGGPHGSEHQAASMTAAVASRSLPVTVQNVALAGDLQGTLLHDALRYKADRAATTATVLHWLDSECRVATAPMHRRPEAADLGQHAVDDDDDGMTLSPANSLAPLALREDPAEPAVCGNNSAFQQPRRARATSFAGVTGADGPASSMSLLTPLVAPITTAAHMTAVLPSAMSLRRVMSGGGTTGGGGGAGGLDASFSASMLMSPSRRGLRGISGRGVTTLPMVASFSPLGAPNDDDDEPFGDSSGADSASDGFLSSENFVGDDGRCAAKDSSKPSGADAATDETAEPSRPCSHESAPHDSFALSFSSRKQQNTKPLTTATSRGSFRRMSALKAAVKVRGALGAGEQARNELRALHALVKAVQVPYGASSQTTRRTLVDATGLESRALGEQFVQAVLSSILLLHTPDLLKLTLRHTLRVCATEASRSPVLLDEPLMRFVNAVRRHVRPSVHHPSATVNSSLRTTTAMGALQPSGLRGVHRDFLVLAKDIRISSARLRASRDRDDAACPRLTWNHVAWPSALWSSNESVLRRLYPVFETSQAELLRRQCRSPSFANFCAASHPWTHSLIESFGFTKLARGHRRSVIAQCDVLEWQTGRTATAKEVLASHRNLHALHLDFRTFCEAFVEGNVHVIIAIVSGRCRIAPPDTSRLLGNAHRGVNSVEFAGVKFELVSPSADALQAIASEMVSSRTSTTSEASGCGPSPVLRRNRSLSSVFRPQPTRSPATTIPPRDVALSDKCLKKSAAMEVMALNALARSWWQYVDSTNSQHCAEPWNVDVLSDCFVSKDLPAATSSGSSNVRASPLVPLVTDDATPPDSASVLKIVYPLRVLVSYLGFDILCTALLPDDCVPLTGAAVSCLDEVAPPDATTNVNGSAVGRDSAASAGRTFPIVTREALKHDLVTRQLCSFFGCVSREFGLSGAFAANKSSVPAGTTMEPSGTGEFVVVSRSLKLTYSPSCDVIFLDGAGAILPLVPSHAGSSSCSRTGDATRGDPAATDTASMPSAADDRTTTVMRDVPVCLRPEMLSNVATAVSADVWDVQPATTVRGGDADDVSHRRSRHCDDCRAEVLKLQSRLVKKHLHDILDNLTTPDRSKGLTPEELHATFHRAGINMRYLGVAADLLSNKLHSMLAVSGRSTSEDRSSDATTAAAGQQQTRMAIDSVRRVIAVMKTEMAVRVFREIVAVRQQQDVLEFLWDYVLSPDDLQRETQKLRVGAARQRRRSIVGFRPSVAERAPAALTPTTTGSEATEAPGGVSQLATWDEHADAQHRTAVAALTLRTLFAAPRAMGPSMTAPSADGQRTAVCVAALDDSAEGATVHETSEGRQAREIDAAACGSHLTVALHTRQRQLLQDAIEEFLGSDATSPLTHQLWSSALVPRMRDKYAVTGTMSRLDLPTAAAAMRVSQLVHVSMSVPSASVADANVANEGKAARGDLPSAVMMDGANNVDGDDDDCGIADVVASALQMPRKLAVRQSSDNLPQRAATRTSQQFDGSTIIKRDVLLYRSSILGHVTKVHASAEKCVNCPSLASFVNQRQCGLVDVDVILHARHMIDDLASLSEHQRHGGVNSETRVRLFTETQALTSKKYPRALPPPSASPTWKLLPATDHLWLSFAMLCELGGDAHYFRAEEALLHLILLQKQSATMEGPRSATTHLALARLYAVEHRYVESLRHIGTGLLSEIWHGRGSFSPRIIPFLDLSWQVCRDAQLWMDAVLHCEALLTSLLMQCHRSAMFDRNTVCDTLDAADDASTPEPPFLFASRFVPVLCHGLGIANTGTASHATTAHATTAPFPGASTSELTEQVRFSRAFCSSMVTSMMRERGSLTEAVQKHVAAHPDASSPAACLKSWATNASCLEGEPLWRATEQYICLLHSATLSADGPAAIAHVAALPPFGAFASQTNGSVSPWCCDVASSHHLHASLAASTKVAPGNRATTASNAAVAANSPLVPPSSASSSPFGTTSGETFRICCSTAERQLFVNHLTHAVLMTAARGQLGNAVRLAARARDVAKSLSSEELATRKSGGGFDLGTSSSEGCTTETIAQSNLTYIETILAASQHSPPR